MKKQNLTIALSMLAGAAFAQQAPIQFAAKGIVAVSDADMAASALVDGNLYKDKGTRDALTLIQFPLNRNGQNINTALVSNSMTLSDKTIAITNNGKLAFVLEGRGQVSDSLPSLKNGIADFPATNAMFVVDLSGAKPAVKFKFPTGPSLSAVTLNPQGSTMLVASNDAGKEIKIIDIDATGKPTRVLVAASPTQGQQITDLVFHPGGQFAAYTIGATGEVGLLKYAIDEKTKKPYVIAHGKPVKVGAMPGSGKFTPDGSFFIIPDGKKALGAGGTGAGEVFVVQFSTEDTAGEHKIVAQAATPEAPEAVAVSPDGSMVAVVSAGQSYAPFGTAGAGKSTVGIYSLAKDGKLTLGNEYPFEGVLPQSVEFDRDGSAIAVAVSEYLDYGNRNGGIEFWTVTKGDKPALAKQPGRVALTRGAHALRVIY
ncbi:WD40 repeat domain-containing protein [Arsenicibacter rosenii]|uniref:WD40 repeat domain-containing protein n=1 Tax=Arsenicibacter rosenii TaxID=1750698 RepID=A0A1S2VFL1_9BACT|nr:hypothetical protein [Arsenicibacter rosenii]OIN56688.1 hypothetical protein BLX24_23155 [Arsenicibacter rosenii]